MCHITPRRYQELLVGGVELRGVGVEHPGERGLVSPDLIGCLRAVVPMIAVGIAQNERRPFDRSFDLGANFHEYFAWQPDDGEFADTYGLQLDLDAGWQGFFLQAGQDVPRPDRIPEGAAIGVEMTAVIVGAMCSQFFEFSSIGEIHIVERHFRRSDADGTVARDDLSLLANFYNLCAEDAPEPVCVLLGAGPEPGPFGSGQVGTNVAAASLAKKRQGAG